MGIFCSCLPLLPVLFRQALTKEVITSKFHSLVSLLRRDETRKAAVSSQNATSWPSRQNDTTGEYLKLVGEPKQNTTIVSGAYGDVPLATMQPRAESFR